MRFLNPKKSVSMRTLFLVLVGVMFFIILAL